MKCFTSGIESDLGSIERSQPKIPRSGVGGRRSQVQVSRFGVGVSGSVDQGWCREVNVLGSEVDEWTLQGEASCSEAV